METIKVNSHYFTISKKSKFYNERLELINWLNSSQENILVIHCNGSRMTKDLFQYLTNKKYTNSKDLQEALTEANLKVYNKSSSQVETICELEGFEISMFTRNIKNEDGKYYNALIVYNPEKVKKNS